jgi:hypothetical protein
MFSDISMRYTIGELYYLSDIIKFIIYINVVAQTFVTRQPTDIYLFNHLQAPILNTAVSLAKSPSKCGVRRKVFTCATNKSRYFSVIFYFHLP